MQRSDRDEMLAAYHALPAAKKTTIQQASDVLGVPRKTLSSWLRGRGEKPGVELNKTGEAVLLKRLKELERELVKEKEARLSEEIVRGEIIKLAAFDPTPPSWVIKPVGSRKSPGVPQLLLSDWHYG
ncbi:MAG: helix-turn-helix domain-containing protein, partial [Usitatibacter sp.]